MRKCTCRNLNNQVPFKCNLCYIKEDFNRACGYTETDWKEDKKTLTWEFEVWMRSREKALMEFNDFIKGCLV